MKKMEFNFDLTNGGEIFREMFGGVRKVVSLGQGRRFVSRTSLSTVPVELDGINVVGTYIVRITTGNGKVYVEKLMVK